MRRTVRQDATLFEKTSRLQSLLLERFAQHWGQKAWISCSSMTKDEAWSQTTASPYSNPRKLNTRLLTCLSLPVPHKIKAFETEQQQRFCSPRNGCRMRGTLLYRASIQQQSLAASAWLNRFAKNTWMISVLKQPRTTLKLQQ